MRINELPCAICGQRANGVFCGLAEQHLAILDRQKAVYEYGRGEALFHEGHQATTAYCVHSGRVKLFKVGRKDEETVIRVLGPGDIIGYRAMLAEEPYAATAETIEPSTVCAISKETILALLQSSPELAIEMLARLSRELRTSEDQMISLLQESVRQRTARVLLWLFEQGKENQAEVAPAPIPLRRKELAQMIGTTPETLSRTLRQFANRGLIELTRTSIQVLNLSPLKRLANSEDQT